MQWDLHSQWSGQRGWRLSYTHTHTILFITLPSLPPSLPPVRQFSLLLSVPHPPSPSLSLLSDWLTEQPASIPLPPSFQKNLRHTPESPNCIMIAFMTIIIHCGTTTECCVFKRKSPLKNSGENWIIVSICHPEYSNNDKRIILHHSECRRGEQHGRWVGIKHKSWEEMEQM